MNEQWKKIEGFEGYEISSKGKLRNKHKRILKTWINHGYVNVEIKKNKKPFKFRIHRLVATAFIPNPKSLPEVHHKNHIRDDNRSENLQWSGKVENKLKMYVRQLELHGYKVIPPMTSTFS